MDPLFLMYVPHLDFEGHFVHDYLGAHFLRKFYMHGTNFKALGHPIRDTYGKFLPAWLSMHPPFVKIHNVPLLWHLFKVFLLIKGGQLHLGHFKKTLELIYG